MISKITMNGVASYKQKTSFETDKRINLIYGLNGTGKSTLSNFLYNRIAPLYSECSVEGISESDELLVYNQKFINDNFYETGDIHGIFTLSKGNKEAKHLIDDAKKEIKKLAEKRNTLNVNKSKGDVSYQKEIDGFKTEAWKIKSEYSGGDRVLEFCLTGLKGNKDTLFNYLLSVKKSEEEITYSAEDLKKEALELLGDVTKESLINPIHIALTSIENSPLMSKEIVGKKNSTVAELIDKLQNSSWVEEGLDYVHFEDENAECPFCQHRTITKELFKKINDFFDETYKNDKNALEELFVQYKAEIQRIKLEIDKIKTNRFMGSLISELDMCVEELMVVALDNTVTIEGKIKNAGIPVALKSSKEFKEKINEVISKANLKISEFNDKIEHAQDAIKSIKDRFWQLMRKEYDSVISLYDAAEKRQNAYVSEYNKQLNEIVIEENKQKNIINDNQKKTVNIDEAVENIKQGLIDIGITDFTIEKYSDDDALYHLKREHSSENVFKSLSEGEKMVISFLYFVELCKGEAMAESTVTNKIVVIDDPISSLSHIYVFNIGRVIHNEFLKTEKYEQIFVLTHSLYFFYELTNINHEQREKTQALFRIIKNDNGSSIVGMKYDEIQNDYQAYWHIIKDENQPPALIANCMRNIIEYFFNFVEKQDFNNVFAKQELKEIRFLAFNRYMNRESHSKGQNIFDIKEFDYGSFRMLLN